MSEASKPAPVHSLGEAYLYARVTPCPVCAGSLDADEAWFGYDPDGRILSMETACRLCGAPFEADFDARGVDEAEFAMLTSGPLAPPWNRPSQCLNPSPQPSRVIDVAGWLALFAWICEQARVAAEDSLNFDPPNRSAIRRMRLTAAACLDEALKFFEDENDLPPDEAFFSDAARRQFWERPELFIRQHIINLRFSLTRS